MQGSVQEAGTESNPESTSRIRCRVRRTRFGIARQWYRELFLISRRQPVEQIYKMLNQEIAFAVVISAGFYKARLWDSLRLKSHRSTNWYVNDYKGPDNLLRAAARIPSGCGTERSINLTVNSEAAEATRAASEKKEAIFVREDLPFNIWRMLQAWSGCR